MRNVVAGCQIAPRPAEGEMTEEKFKGNRQDHPNKPDLDQRRGGFWRCEEWPGFSAFVVAISCRRCNLLRRLDANSGQQLPLERGNTVKLVGSSGGAIVITTR
jgi:hypothetical protein